MPGLAVFVLLCPEKGRNPFAALARHFARLVLKPGRAASLKLVAARRVIVLPEPLDSVASIEKIRRLGLDVGLHKTGTIYRQPTIEAFRLGILNSHIGLLPEYRGRCVVEWALIEGAPVGVTVFFIDSGIDTGEKIVLRETVDISHCNSVAEAKEYLFGLDARYYRRAVEQLKDANFEYASNTGAARRYFVMSQLLIRAADAILND